MPWVDFSNLKIQPYFDPIVSKGVTCSDSIAVMKFEVIGNTGDTSTLTGTVTTASKTDGTAISVNHGEFRMGTSQIKGDCDGDGKLTVKDALVAIQMSVVKMAVDMCCDYNKDGRVDSMGVRLRGFVSLFYLNIPR